MEFSDALLAGLGDDLPKYLDPLSEEGQFFVGDAVVA